MTLVLYAQPYDITAEGFYFRDASEYDAKAEAARNAYGEPIEEFEIQFIDGEAIDCELAKAIDLSQATFRRFLELADELEEFDKIILIIAVADCGYDLEAVADNIGGLALDIYEEASFDDLARRFVEDGLYGDIPEALRFYIDYEAIGRDLAIDYGAVRIDGRHFIYRCG